MTRADSLTPDGSMIDTSLMEGNNAVSRASEIAQEQSYFDVALEYREQARHQLGDVASAAASPKDAVSLRAGSDRCLSTFRGPEEAVAFGRIDSESEPLYIGYQLITDDHYDPLVINWQTSAGTRFYEASHDDPLGVDRKRQFNVEDNSNLISDFEDILFSDLAARVSDLQEPDEMDDTLLTDLQRTRTGEMQDIVRTIRAAQHEIIRADMDQLLLVQGGPGTGKTAVALHRVSWLLFNHRERLKPANVAVIGPNTTFIRYIRSVLPSLGDGAVNQIALTGLGPAVRQGRVELGEVATIKGQARMMPLLERALDDRISVPDGKLEIPSGTRTIRLDAAEVTSNVDRFRTSSYAAGRNALRDHLRRKVGDNSVAVDSLVERIWPQLTALSFLQDLLGSEARLLRAAGDDFTAREVRMLHRRSADRLSEEIWASGDVPLLDYASHLIAGQTPERYAHIVVDEAQDISPMQLASLARRSENGSMTILGDIAQSTGPWARDRWDDVIEALRFEGTPVTTSELGVGYRVPRQAFELARPLLPHIAPDVSAPRVVRDGPEPLFHQATDDSDRAQQAVAQAMHFASLGLTVGVIALDPIRAEIEVRCAEHGVRVHDGAEEIATGINLLPPESSKGLEFDAIVLLEPEAIAASGDHGLRLLYIALTRTTKHLSIVHIGAPMPTLGPASVSSTPAIGRPLPPPPLPPPPPIAIATEPMRQAPPPRAHGTASTRRRPRTVELLARSVADEIRNGLPENLWDDFLGALPDELAEDQPTTDDEPDNGELHD